MQKLERIRNNIVLVGPMGCGKTAVGKLLARILNWEFIDTDQRIVEQTGLEIPMIFQEKGEQGFRQLEKEVISECSQMHQVVIATGGGIVIDQENRRVLKENGLVYYLKTSPSILSQRVGCGKGRPLLYGKDPQTVFKQILKEREDFYQQADVILETDELTQQQVAEEIIMESRRRGILSLDDGFERL